MDETVLGAETNKALLVRLTDPAALARAQGALAALAAGAAPATIEGKVYEGFRDEIKKSLQTKGIGAEVSIVEPRAFSLSTGGRGIATDIGLAIGGAGVVGILWWLFAHAHRAHRGRR